MIAIKSASPVLVVITGAALGLLSFFSPGTVFGVFAALLAVFMITRVSGRDDKIFLVTLFIIGLSVRVLLLLATQFILITHGKLTFQLGDSATCLFGDDAYYTLRSWWIAKCFLGMPVSHAIREAAFTKAGLTGYFYSTALFYYLFGFSPVSGLFLNCIFSALTGVVYYLIAKDTANERAAKITGFLVVFFPSMIIWSIINLKDSAFIFFTSLILWAFVRLLNSDKGRYLLLLSIALIAQFLIRLNLAAVSIVSIIILGFCYMVARKKLKILPILIICVILSANFSGLKRELGSVKTRIISYHVGVIGRNGFKYNLYDDWVYKTYADISKVSGFEVVKIAPKALAHFFLEPFPWKACSFLSLASLPQMMVWYLLLPFSVLGVLIQLKIDWRKNLIFPVYFLAVGTILSLAGGNIGTNFRIRDMLTPLVLYFAAVAISKVVCFKTNEVHEALDERRGDQS